IVHRDIKPANVLLTRSGEVKLADLGLATVRCPSATVGEGPVPASARVGTACYMAPELAGSNRPADARSDIYSLGATFCHALPGGPPFAAETAWEMIERHAKAPPPNPRDRVPTLPIDLADLVLRMLAKDPQQRPGSFEALLAEPALNRPYPGAQAEG